MTAKNNFMKNVYMSSKISSIIQRLKSPQSTKPETMFASEPVDDRMTNFFGTRMLEVTLDRGIAKPTASLYCKSQQGHRRNQSQTNYNTPLSQANFTHTGTEPLYKMPHNASMARSFFN
jgi:hypothetical protein